MLALGACQTLGIEPEPPDPELVKEPPGPREPARVVVQHCLIASEEADLLGVTRTPAEAERVAKTVYEKARGGAEFGDLVRLYSDDLGADGLYDISNFGVPAQRPDGIERNRVVKGIANAAFTMEPGGVALVPYDPEKSPLGWHVVKRIE
jgi:parvulin-like peptidyl-prolyl isomerase